MVYQAIGFLATLLAVAHAGIIGPAGTTVAVAQPTATVLRAEDYDPNPQYSFSYSVADGLTGDNKAQEETRSGDVVQGSYSLIEPDGSRRVVSYAADPINGFNAVVQRDPSITVKTVAAAAPVATAVRPAAVAVRPQAIVGSPVLRESLVSGPALTASNVITANGLLGLGLGLGIRPGGLYGTQAILAGTGYGAGYGAGGIVKVH